jgi:hypothetical protein
MLALILELVLLPCGGDLPQPTQLSRDTCSHPRASAAAMRRGSPANYAALTWYLLSSSCYCCGHAAGISRKLLSSHVILALIFELLLWPCGGDLPQTTQLSRDACSHPRATTASLRRGSPANYAALTWCLLSSSCYCCSLAAGISRNLRSSHVVLALILELLLRPCGGDLPQTTQLSRDTCSHPWATAAALRRGSPATYAALTWCLLSSSCYCCSLAGGSPASYAALTWYLLSSSCYCCSLAAGISHNLRSSHAMLALILELVLLPCGGDLPQPTQLSRGTDRKSVV